MVPYMKMTIYREASTSDMPVKNTGQGYKSWRCQKVYGCKISKFGWHQFVSNVFGKDQYTELNKLISKY